MSNGSGTTKHVTYQEVRIVTVGGVITIKPNTNGYAFSFVTNSEPRTSFGKNLETAGESLVKDLRFMIEAIESDIKAFVERNR